LKQKLLFIASRLSLILFGLFFGLIALEIGFRILYPDPSPKLVNQGLQFHPTYGLAFTPGAEGWNTSLRGEYSTYITINNKGLRGQEYPYTKEAGTFRILVLGDSFTAGLQVPEEETFAKLLEARLNQHDPKTRFEVINAGIIGYGTDKELAYYAHEGYKYQPDLVLLAFFTGNDITDNIWYSLYELKENELVPVPPSPHEDNLTPNWAKDGSLFKKIRNFLYTHSRLYSVSIELLTLSAVQRVPAVAQWLVSLGFVELTRPMVNYGNLYAFRYLPDEAWETTRALLVRLNQEVEVHGSQLLVVSLPDETDVDEERRREILETYAHLTKQEALQGPRPTDRLAEILQQAGIAYVQLLPALQAYHRQSQSPLYYKYDGHWTPAGHQVAGQAIYEYLVQNQDKLANFPVVVTHK
jgi:lysophospholipase L1-like esterase